LLKLNFTEFPEATVETRMLKHEQARELVTA